MRYDHVTMQPRTGKRFIDFINYYKYARKVHKMDAKNSLEYARALSAPIFYKEL